MGRMVITLALLAGLAVTAHGQPAGEKPDKECCDTKTVGGVTYSLIGQMDTKMYNCLSDCIYMKEGQEGGKFCFAMGDLQVECNDEEMEGSEKPPMEGSEKPPMGGSEMPPMEGSEMPPMEGSEKPPMEGSEKPPVGEGASAAPGETEGGNEGGDCSYPAAHTMTVYPGPADECGNELKFTGLDEATKKTLLDKHNELRQKVASGGEAGQPGAANMKKLVWDDELATIAQRWTDQC